MPHSWTWIYTSCLSVFILFMILFTASTSWVGTKTDTGGPTSTLFNQYMMW